MNARLIDIAGNLTKVPISDDLSVQELKRQLAGSTKKKYDLIFCGRKLEDNEMIKNLEDIELNIIVVQEVVTPVVRYRVQHFARRNIEEELLQRVIQASITQNSHPSQMTIVQAFSNSGRNYRLRQRYPRPSQPQRTGGHRLMDYPPAPTEVINSFPYREQIQPSTTPLPVHPERPTPAVPSVRNENNIESHNNGIETNCSLHPIEIPDPDEHENFHFLSSDDDYIPTDI